MASLARSVGRVAAVASPGYASGIRSTWAGTAGTSYFHLRSQRLLRPAAARGFLTTSHPRHAVVCFKLADIGEGIAQVELTKWYKKVGDDVGEMEEVCEVQSDKAAVEITSRYTGKIVKLYAKEGETVKIGGPLLDIDAPDVDEPHSDASQSAPASEAPKAAETRTPGQQAPTPKSEKVWVALSLVTYEDGLLRVHENPQRTEGLASPAVRRFAKEKGVNLENITGTGSHGAITKEDVLRYIASAPSPSASGPSVAKSEPSVSTVSRENKEIPLQGFSKAMVKSMNESLKVPHMNIGDEYDVTRLSMIRQVLNKELASQDVKLSLTAFLIKAMSIAMDEYPIVNSKFNTETQNSYTQFGSHNVSVAIDSPAGLVVPCVKNVQDLSLVQIQRELVRLQGLAKANRLAPSDLTGGTISLSNVGVISGTYIHPLLFDGQAVIVGVGRVRRLPRFVEQETEDGVQSSLEARDLINCSFSADHRHCDGATITRFSKRIKTLLENPELMLAYMKSNPLGYSTDFRAVTSNVAKRV